MLSDRVPMKMDGWCAMWWHFYHNVRFPSLSFYAPFHPTAKSIGTNFDLDGVCHSSN